MCGRYTLSSPTDLLADLFELERLEELAPRFNIAPTQESAVIRLREDSQNRELAMLRWGLVPVWAKDPTIGNRMINARSETVAEKPSFRTSFKRRRCIVVADGFYEWGKIDGRKQPFHFRLADDGPFAMAGLWDRWEKGDEGPLGTFAILTGEPNQVVAPVHHRMPVILQPGTYQEWLDPNVEDLAALQPLMEPFPTELLVGYPVSTYVNSPSNDSPECIRQLD